MRLCELCFWVIFLFFCVGIGMFKYAVKSSQHVKHRTISQADSSDSGLKWGFIKFTVLRIFLGLPLQIPLWGLEVGS